MDATEGMLRNILLLLQAYLRNQGSFQIINLNIPFKKLGKEEQILKTSRKKELI